MTENSQDPDEIFQKLAEGSPRFMQSYLAHEAPQTVAAILLLQPPARAAEVLNGLPSDIRHRAIHCMTISRPMLAPAKAALARTLAAEFPLAVPATVPIEDVQKIVELMHPDLRDDARLALRGPIAAEEPQASDDQTAAAPSRTPSVPPAPVGDPNDKFERWPLLEVVYDRFVRRTATSLRRLTGENLEVSLHSITSLYFANYLSTIPLPVMLGAFKVRQWPGSGMLAAEPAVVETMVAALLGGRNHVPARTVEDRRPFTMIERDLFGLVASTMLDGLSKAFDVVGPVTFDFERVETNPRFAAIAPPMSAAILARLDIAMEDGGGRFELLLPYESLTPVRELLLQTIQPPVRVKALPGQEQVA